MPNTIDLPPATDASVPVVFFKRTAKGKSSFRKRAPTPPPRRDDSDSDTDDDDDADDTGSDGAKTARPVKKRKRNVGGVVAASTSTTTRPDGHDQQQQQHQPDVGAATYTATSRDIVSSTASEATKQSNWYDEDPEAALLGRRRRRGSRDGGGGGEGEGEKEGGSVDGAGPSTYKGAAGYGSFIRKSEANQRKPVGPVKAPTNIRTITVTDYAPDVCKDYKLTGFCGFGDTCKFLHAREDYAAGWKIDREWEIKQSGQKLPELQGKRMGTGWKKDAGDDGEEEEVPFKCVICKDDYKSPIQTKCGHYFCEKCAVERYKKKNPGCAICGRRTDGVFNGAKGFQKKLDRAREREEERRKKEEEEKEKEAG